MFQFPTFALGNGFLSRSVSRFGHPRLKCLRTANRGFSQLITSFVASQRQGIHRLLLIACSSYLHPNVAHTCSRGPDFAISSAWSASCETAWATGSDRPRFPCGGVGCAEAGDGGRSTGWSRRVLRCLSYCWESLASRLRFPGGRRARSLVCHCETGFQRALSGVPKTA